MFSLFIILGKLHSTVHMSAWPQASTSKLLNVFRLNIVLEFHPKTSGVHFTIVCIGSAQLLNLKSNFYFMRNGSRYKT